MPHITWQNVIEGSEQADRVAKEAAGWRQIYGRHNMGMEFMTNAVATRSPYQNR
jgi:hypothetical protein